MNLEMFSFKEVVNGCLTRFGEESKTIVTSIVTRYGEESVMDTARSTWISILKKMVRFFQLKEEYTHRWLGSKIQLF